MLLREHAFKISLFDAQRTYAELEEILRFKLKLKRELTGTPDITWCINNEATRCVVMKISDDKFCLFTAVENQKYPQDWEWIDRCFDHERLNLLAISDVKMGMACLLDEARGVFTNGNAAAVHDGLPS